MLPAQFAGWYVIALPEPIELGDKDPASDDDRVLVALARNPDLRWAALAAPGETARACGEIARMVEHSPRGTRWQEVGVMGTMRLTPGPRLGDAENAVNGYHRRFSRAPTHMWISDPACELPQQLLLSWPEPRRLDRVTLTFDNLCAARHDNPWESGTRVAPWLVRSYALAVWEDDGWREIVRIEDNHHRFRAHVFAPLSTTRLCLTVHATHGLGYPARVYQISAYGRASPAC